MAERDWFNAVVAAYLGTNVSPNDPAILREPTMVQLYGQLQSIQQKLAADLLEHDDKIYLAKTKGAIAMGDQLADLHTQLMHERAASSRTALETRTSANNNLMRVNADLMGLRDNVDSGYRSQLLGDAAAKVGAEYNTTNEALIHTALVTGYKPFNALDGGARNAAGTITSVLSEAGVNIEAPDYADQIREQMGDSAFTKEAINAAAKHRAQVLDLDSGVQLSRNLINQGAELGEIEAALRAHPSDGDLQAQRKAKEDEYLATMDALRTYQHKVYGGAEGIIADIEKFKKEGANKMAQYDQVIQAVAQHIIGPAAAGPERGKLVSDPSFRNWASLNGIDPDGLGHLSEEGRYVEGGNDTEAITLWRYQMMHPDKLRPMQAKGSRTGKVALVEQDYTPETMAKFAQAPDGKYYIRQTDSGNKPVRKTDEVLKISESGGYVFDRDGKTYVVELPQGMPDYTLRVGKLEKLASMIKEMPPGPDRDAKIRGYQKISGQLREAFPDHKQFEAFTNYTKALETPEKDDDSAALEGLAVNLENMQISEVRSDGSVRRVPHSEYQDVISAVGEKGEKTFDPTMFNPENLKMGSDFIEVTAPNMIAVDASKLPKRQMYVEVDIPSANDYKDGEWTLRGRTVAGDVALNMSKDSGNKIVDVVEAGSGLRVIKDLTPQEMFNQAKGIVTEEDFERDLNAERGPSGKEPRKEELSERRQEKIARSVGKELAEKEADESPDITKEEVKLARKGEVLHGDVGSGFESELTPSAQRQAKRDRYEEIGRKYITGDETGAITREHSQGIGPKHLTPKAARNIAKLPTSLSGLDDFDAQMTQVGAKYTKPPGITPQEMRRRNVEDGRGEGDIRWGERGDPLSDVGPLVERPKKSKLKEGSMQVEATANIPGFDPNKYRKANPSDFDFSIFDEKY